jgi:hypothetical protein
MLVAIQADELAAEHVAAGSRDPVHEHACGLVLRGATGDLHRNLLRLRLVVVDARALTAGKHRVGDHPVDERARVTRLRAMRQQAAAGPHRARPSDVEHAGAHGGHGAGEQLKTAACRKRRDQLLRHHLTSVARLHIDHRSFSGDGDVLFQRAKPHLDVDRRGEIRLEDDSVADDGVEASELEAHRVDAGPQIDDPVLAGFVRGGRLDLLDQRGAAGFNGDAWQHSACGIAHEAGDCTLRQ